MKRFFFGAWLCLLHMNSAFADAFRPDDHAPIGVMADHQHKKGEWMMSYRYMGMTSGWKPGWFRSFVSIRSAIERHWRLPGCAQRMDMEMHMLGVMYAPSDKYTLMLMVPYLSSEMDHVTAMGGEFSTEASDLGDVSLSVISTNSLGFTWHLGVSIPSHRQSGIKRMSRQWGVQCCPIRMQRSGPALTTSSQVLQGNSSKQWFFRCPITRPLSSWRKR